MKCCANLSCYYDNGNAMHCVLDKMLFELEAKECGMPYEEE